MKNYRVNVNGTIYEVSIEVISENEVTAKAPAAQAPTASAAPAAHAPAAPVSAPAGAQTISAPMPGTILDVKVANGQSVKKGDLLFILEAMKMENEILAPADGTVAAVTVSKGATVASGDTLCSIA